MDGYRAVGTRCAIDFRTLRLPLSEADALNILERKGFRSVRVDPVELARACVGKAAYRRGARQAEAPTVFDCSGLTKWVYGCCGIWLPRRSIQQRSVGHEISVAHIRAGDLVFTTGFMNYFDIDPADGVGHVGIATAEGTIVHAANRSTGIVETPLDRFVADAFRGARRIVLEPEFVLTLETPRGREVETADDIRWIILQTLPKQSH